MAVTRRRAAAAAAASRQSSGGLGSLVPTMLRRSATSTSTSSRSTTSSSSSSSPAFVIDAWTFLLAFVAIAHLAAAPFTKVEESFGMQAVHDLLFLGPRKVREFDHAMFPGVVPRTFLAPAAVAALSALPTFAALRLGLATAKLAAGVFARATLAMLSIASLSRLRGAVERSVEASSSSTSTSSSKGKRVSAFLALLTALQFHLPFYLSRTLPNTFATVATTLALADWLDGTPRTRRALALLAAAAAALRCDVLLLAAAVGLHVLLTRRLSFVAAVAASLAGGLGAAVASVAFDSHFWGRGALSESAARKFGWSNERRLVWPELMVLLFNAPTSSSSSSSSSSSGSAVISSASSEWGVSPWHWYATSALPRALGAAGVLGFLWAVVFLSPSSESKSKSQGEKRTKKEKKKGGGDDEESKSESDNRVVSVRHAAAVAAAFVALYSFLPHKELRFLLPVLPLFNVVSAFGLADAWGQGDDEESVAEEENADDAADDDEKKATKKKKKNGSKSPSRLRRGLLRLFFLPGTASAGFLLVLFARCLVAAALAATAATTGLSLAAASKNYPGGVALERLHLLIDNGGEGERDVRIHIDVAAAQQGITRFGERGDIFTFSSSQTPPSSSPSSSPSSASSSSNSRSWSYSKDESLEPHELASAGFTHLVTEQRSVPGFEAIEAVEGFAGMRLVVPSSSSSSPLSSSSSSSSGEEEDEKQEEEELRASPGALVRALRARKVPRLRLKTEPRIYLHRRKRNGGGEGQEAVL